MNKIKQRLTIDNLKIKTKEVIIKRKCIKVGDKLIRVSEINRLLDEWSYPCANKKISITRESFISLGVLEKSKEKTQYDSRYGRHTKSRISYKKGSNFDRFKKKFQELTR